MKTMSLLSWYSLRMCGRPSIIEVDTTTVAPTTMSAMVTSTQLLLAPAQTMIVAPMKRMMSPVPRSGRTRMSPKGTQSVAHTLT